MTPDVPPLHRFAHEAMTTEFEVVVAGQEETYARQAAAAVFNEIDRLEGILSRFQPVSDIAQLNRLRPGESLRVCLEAFECLQLAAQVHADTGGAFDITVGPLMNLMRDAKGNWQRITDAELAVARAAVGMERLVLNPQDFTVTVRPAAGAEPSTRLEVDLGAIGKGYALDKAAELLSDWEIPDVLLHSGTSSVLALGNGGEAAGCPAGKNGWPLGVAGDWADKAGFDAVLLSGAALSGSGTEVKGQHVLDPRTGRPASNHLAAWAIASSAALSDALSTAFMVMTTAEVNSYCWSHVEVAALVVEKRRGLLRMLGDKATATPTFVARALRCEKGSSCV
ncbi:MAG: FAD:protein FMN transferase [Verrucomicrobia bacterium]|nr:FAD:protein FMN transferase [Verrucomicrobiota bacterium]